jgi:enoyl-CoA hydratase
MPDADAGYRSLTVEIADHVAEVVLRGPGKGNAMGPDFWREMPLVFEALDGDERVRAVLIRGAGGHFSYGLDLPAMLGEMTPLLTGEALAAVRTRLLDVIGAMQRACDRVAACRKPVVAAIAGRCVGGGVDLAAACDVRLCSSSASFSVREVRLAMVADMGSLQRLPRIIGDGATRELAFTGKDIDAARALRIGLVSDVLDGEEALLAAARATVRAIADNPPLAVQGIKQVMNYCDGKPVSDGQRYVAVWNAAFLQSKDLMEAFAAFLEKRRPEWKGE